MTNGRSGARRKAQGARQDCWVVLVTCPRTAQTQRLAKALVSKRLAACVNLVPGVDSLFWWKGTLDRAKEALLIIKTTAGAYPSLQRAIRALHPYQTPEIIALPIARGHAPYLRWVRDSVAAK